MLHVSNPSNRKRKLLPASKFFFPMMESKLTRNNATPLNKL